MKKKKFVLFTEKYDPEKFDRQSLPVDIFNSTGAILAHEGHKLPKERLTNAYIYIDDVFQGGDVQTEEKEKPQEKAEAEEKKVLQPDKKEIIAEAPAKEYKPSYKPGFETSDQYEEESADDISKRLFDLEFEPIPKIKNELRANIYNLKELFQTKIVDNMAYLTSGNNEKLSMQIAEYLDYILEINMYAADYIDMVTAVRNRDNYVTFSHALAVGFYAMAIAKKLKMLKEDYLVNDNLGRWLPMKTTKHDKKSGPIPLSNQLLKYIDYQKSNIAVRYGPEVRDLLYEQLHDLMHDYSKINRADKYPSLLPNFDDSNRKLIAMAALNIDIGKVCISNSILNKSGELTPEEWVEVKKHPVFSVVKLKEVGVNQPKMFAYIIGHHIVDPVRGYPSVKENPPPESKIIAVADIYDAMTSPRHYGKQYSNAEAILQIKDLFDRGFIDAPLYLTAIHTFQEYNHQFVKRRHKKVVDGSDAEKEEK